jgi:hypothetical protein
MSSGIRLPLRSRGNVRASGQRGFVRSNVLGRDAKEPPCRFATSPLLRSGGSGSV